MNRIKFGGTAKEQDELAELVLKKEKTATSSLYVRQELGQQQPTKVGDSWMIVNSQDLNICQVIVRKVSLIPFSEIDEAFARAEGDGSLANWTAIHQNYYGGILEKLNVPLSEETILECVYFERV